jgi:hypothetical protein
MWLVILQEHFLVVNKPYLGGHQIIYNWKTQKFNIEIFVLGFLDFY